MRIPPAYRTSTSAAKHFPTTRVLSKVRCDLRVVCCAALKSRRNPPAEPGTLLFRRAGQNTDRGMIESSLYRKHSLAMNEHSRTAILQDLLPRRILLLDGAMGTMIQSYKLNEADYRGTRFADFPHDLKGNNDLLTLTQPQIIHAIH